MQVYVRVDDGDGGEQANILLMLELYCRALGSDILDIISDFIS